MNQAAYLQDTAILDFNHQSIDKLSRERNWDALDEYERIGAIYRYVQNEIVFGYNESDEIPASKVIKDGYGQCNTKANLLMALFRKHRIPCRFHGFTINKELQKGAISGLYYKLAPESIIHSWVEIYYEGKWINLEGFILDQTYLNQIQLQNPGNAKKFCGYGIATKHLADPPVKWKGRDTYIQKEGINHDFGVFESPDEFYQQHGSNLSGVKKLLYKYFVRKRINANVDRIRKS